MRDWESENMTKIEIEIRIRTTAIEIWDFADIEWLYVLYYSLSLLLCFAYNEFRIRDSDQKWLRTRWVFVKKMNACL